MSVRCRFVLSGYLLVALCAPVAHAQTAAPAVPDRAAWQSDYALLKQALERDYANLAWMGSPQSGVDLPALDRQTARGLATAENDDQAERALRDFVAGFHDGHFSFLPTLAAHEKTDDPPQPGVAALDAPAGCAALGFAPAGRTAFSLPFESLPGFVLHGDGVSQAFRSGVLTTAGGVRIGILRIQNFEPKPFPALCTAAWNEVKTLDSPSRMEDDLQERWFDDMAATLHDLRDARVDLVLVDVGHNSGGNDSGDMAVRLFTDRPVHSSPMLVSQTASGDAYLDEQLQILRGDLGKHPGRAETALLQQAIGAFSASKRAIAAPRCDLSWVWRERRDWHGGGCRRLLPAGSSGGPMSYLASTTAVDAGIAGDLNWALTQRDHWGAWTGPVYVLANERSYSSAEMFIATLRDNGIARIIGTRTGGDGCGFVSDADPLLLPHSRLRLRMPNCVRLRADGSNEMAGVVPDLPVSPREGESDRARAQRVAETIAADVRRSPGAAPTVHSSDPGTKPQH